MQMQSNSPFSTTVMSLVSPDEIQTHANQTGGDKSIYQSSYKKLH